MDTFLVSLEHLHPSDLPTVGAKALGLGRLLRAGLPVPRGLCLRTTAFLLWLESAPGAQRLIQALNDIPVTKDFELTETAGQLQKALSMVPVPLEVNRALEKLDQFPGLSGALAVRSSGISEDLLQASFAGQYRSVLNVQGASHLVEAIRQCWVSAFSTPAVLYRAKNKIPQSRAAMAVVLQAFLPAEKSGVFFTVDPVTGDRSRMIVESVWGIGESLVSGVVAPDRFVLESSTGKTIALEIGSKCQAFYPGKSGGLETRRVCAGDRERTSLEDWELVELARLAKSAEALMGGPQDVEWAVCGNQAWLLQTRPVTALPSHVESEEVWTYANACETFPDVVTPLSWSGLEAVLVRAARPILQLAGVRTDRPWFKLINGRVYISLSVTMDLLGPLGFMGISDLQRSFGLVGLLDPKGELTTPARQLRARTRWRFKFSRLPIQCWTLLHVFFGVAVRTKRSFADLLATVVQESGSVDFDSFSDRDLAEFPATFVRTLGSKLRGNARIARMLGCLVGGLASALAYERLSRRWLGDRSGAAARLLLGGTGTLASAQSGLDLWNLATFARQMPPLSAEILEAQDFKALSGRLQQSVGGRHFLERWEHFMQQHGHHARGELDWASPRWSEKPDYVLGLVRNYLRAAPEFDPLQSQAKADHERELLARECVGRLPNAAKRWLCLVLLSRGRQGLADRENMKNQAVRACAVLRRCMLEAGSRFAQRGYLASRDEIFFLNLHEVRELLLGQTISDLGDRVAARKAEVAKNRELEPPMLVYGSGIPDARRPTNSGTNGKILRGIPASPGVGTGRARVVLHSDQDTQVLPGEVLVAPFTDPAWSPYFLTASAIVVDSGGILSHGSVVAREYGIPAVVNVSAGTRILQTGQLIQVDGNEGTVTLL